MSQRSISTGAPPSEVTASTRKSVSLSRQRRAIGSSGCQAPVEVSACTMATALTGPDLRNAWSMASGSMTCPHGASTRIALPPQRSTMVVHLVPNTPLTPTITASPGSMIFTAEPVPETAMVKRFLVSKTKRNRTWISFMRARKAGSKWPSRGVEMARRTRGCTMLGPGPRSSRRGGVKF